jgi:FkbM family methyltransferase
MRTTDFLGIKLYLHPQGDVVCDNIAKHVPAEEHLVDYFNKLIKPTDVIVEGGVHVGVHTVRFSQLANQGHIYSFEASRRNYNLASLTLQNNNIENVTLYNQALYSKNTTMYLAESWTPDQDSITGTPTNTSIDAVTIDSLQLPKVDFIKLDIEGGELDALHGAAQTLIQHKPIITFEYLEHLGHKSPISFLKENGYDVFKIDTHWDYIAFHKSTDYESNLQDI